VYSGGAASDGICELLTSLWHPARFDPDCSLQSGPPVDHYGLAYSRVCQSVSMK